MPWGKGTRASLNETSFERHDPFRRGCTLSSPTGVNFSAWTGAGGLSRSSESTKSTSTSPTCLSARAMLSARIELPEPRGDGHGVDTYRIRGVVLILWALHHDADALLAGAELLLDPLIGGAQTGVQRG